VLTGHLFAKKPLPVNTGKKQAIRGGLAGMATRFKPGQSGNPAGRPKALRHQLIQEGKLPPYQGDSQRNDLV
jgi:hypothetical protein